MKIRFLLIPIFLALLPPLLLSPAGASPARPPAANETAPAAPDRIPLPQVSTGTTTLVSVAGDGAPANRSTQANWGAYRPSISADGRFVVFHSKADNLVEDDTNLAHDTFVHDLQTGQTTRVSVASDGTERNSDYSSDDYSSISANGRFVAFGSWAAFVDDDTNYMSDIYVHDGLTKETSRVSLAPDGSEIPYPSSNFDARMPRLPSISADGRFVTFQSYYDFPGQINGEDYIFMHDRQTKQTTIVSITPDGDFARQYPSFSPILSANGRFVAFRSNSHFGDLSCDYYRYNDYGCDQIYVRDLGDSGYIQHFGPGHE